MVKGLKRIKTRVKERLGGICKEVYYDNKINELNLQLCEDKLGTPLILFQDWSEKKDRTLITLHIKEAIELKSVIDQLVFDWHEYELEKLKECPDCDGEK